MLDLMQFTNGPLGCQFHKRCARLGVEVFVKFHGCNLWCISKRKEDKLCWTTNTGFTVSSYYRVLIGNGDLSPPWKCIWKSQILSRVAFFV